MAFNNELLKKFKISEETKKAIEHASGDEIKHDLAELIKAAARRTDFKQGADNIPTMLSKLKSRGSIIDIFTQAKNRKKAFPEINYFSEFLLYALYLIEALNKKNIARPTTEEMKVLLANTFKKNVSFQNDVDDAFGLYSCLVNDESDLTKELSKNIENNQNCLSTHEETNKEAIFYLLTPESRKIRKIQKEEGKKQTEEKRSKSLMNEKLMYVYQGEFAVELNENIIIDPKNNIPTWHQLYMNKLIDINSKNLEFVMGAEQLKKHLEKELSSEEKRNFFINNYQKKYRAALQAILKPLGCISYECRISIEYDANLDSIYINAEVSCNAPPTQFGSKGDIGKIILRHEVTENDFLFVSAASSNYLLHQCIAERKAPTEDEIIKAHAEEKLISFLKDIQAQASDLEKRGFKSNATQAKEFITELDQERRVLYKGDKGVDSFISAADEAMLKADKHLSKHRNWKGKLANFGVAVTGIGLAFMAVKKLFTNRFQLFPTKTSKLLDKLQAHITEMKRVFDERKESQKSTSYQPSQDDLTSNAVSLRQL